MAPPVQSPDIRTSDLRAAFEQTLRDGSLFDALRFLNSTTTYRFTGVYHFEPGLVKSLVLYDREHPHLRVGSDVPWFDSYCMMTAEDGEKCEIQNSLSDTRLANHAARSKVLSYCAVLLRTPEQEALGTLCHYDVRPVSTEAAILEGLRECRTAVEHHLWQDLHLRHLPLPAG